MPVRRSASLTSSGMPARTPTTSAAAISPSAPPMRSRMRSAMALRARLDRGAEKRERRRPVRLRGKLRAAQEEAAGADAVEIALEGEVVAVRPHRPGRRQQPDEPGDQPIPPRCRQASCAPRRARGRAHSAAPAVAVPVTSMVSRTRPLARCSIAATRPVSCVVISPPSILVPARQVSTLATSDAERRRAARRQAPDATPAATRAATARAAQARRCRRQAAKSPARWPARNRRARRPPGRPARG